MKLAKLALITLTISGAVLIFLLLIKKTQTPKTTQLQTEKILSGTSTPAQKSKFIGDYSYYDYEINLEKQEVSIHSNLKELNFSESKKKELNCEFMTNAGFYTEDKKHIGLFKQDRQIISRVKKHNLFNSFVGFDNSFKKFYIGKEALTEEYENIFQTGPMLFLDGQMQNLKLADDNYARRVVVVQTDNEKILFIAFFNPRLKTSGPMLKDLPNLLQKYADIKGINIVKATNLDGGNHSLFSTSEINLPELSRVGGFICAKTKKDE